MRLETKIATLLMLAALAMSSCTKKTITPAPAPDPQPAEGFPTAEPTRKCFLKKIFFKSRHFVTHTGFSSHLLAP